MSNVYTEDAIIPITAELPSFDDDLRNDRAATCANNLRNVSEAPLPSCPVVVQDATNTMNPVHSVQEANSLVTTNVAENDGDSD